MNWFNGERNPEIRRERAERLRRIRADLRGVGWSMLATQLIQTGGALILMSILIGWKLAPEISALSGGAARTLDRLYERVPALVSKLTETDWYANVVAAVTVVVAILGVIPLLVYARRRNIEMRPFLSLKGLGAGWVAALYLAMLGLNALGALGVMATEALFNRAGYSIYVDIITGDTPFSFWLVSAYAVLLAPVVEEYMYRGALLDGLRRYGDHFAVMASAVIFGLAHGNLMQFLPVTLIGWFLGYVRVKTGSWGVCVLLHALNNLTSLALDALLERITNESLYTAANLVYLAVAVAAFALVWRRAKARHGELAEAEDPVGYTALISAPALIYLYLVFQMMVMNVTKLA